MGQRCEKSLHDQHSSGIKPATPLSLRKRCTNDSAMYRTPNVHAPKFYKKENSWRISDEKFLWRKLLQMQRTLSLLVLSVVIRNHFLGKLGRKKGRWEREWRWKGESKQKLPIAVKHSWKVHRHESPVSQDSFTLTVPPHSFENQTSEKKKDFSFNTNRPFCQ